MYRDAIVLFLQQPHPSVTPLGLQNWELILSSLEGRSHDGDSKSGTEARRKKAQGIIAGALGQSGISPLTESKWLGRSVSLDDDISPGMTREIFWDLCELTFRLELMTLNDILSTPNDTIIHRRARVVRCFDNVEVGTLLAPKPGDGVRGLADIDEHVRWKYTFALCRVLVHWPGGEVLMDITDCTPDRAGSELRILTFYCQSAFRHLGHYPTLPRTNRGCIY
jgi:hypothetical protein